ncbi:MAG TPA: helix-turn-helix transcriptional regulator [Lysobacter sp.]
MHLTHELLREAQGTELHRDPERGALAHCVSARGRGTHVHAPQHMLTLWLCLRGRLEVEAVDGPFALAPRQFLCLPGSGPARGVARVQSGWLVLALPRATLAQLQHAGGRELGAEPLLFPTVLPVTRELLRCVGQLRREGQRQPGGTADLLLEAVLRAAVHAQAPTEAWVAGAPGRTLANRRRVVMRLLSARNRILNQTLHDHDLETLAATARYSKSHFLRLFRLVFGSTPYDALLDARMDRARHLIDTSDITIGEVAAHVGYESRHAFSRVYKKRFGITATHSRRIADGLESAA